MVHISKSYNKSHGKVYHYSPYHLASHMATPCHTSTCKTPARAAYACILIQVHMTSQYKDAVLPGAHSTNDFSIVIAIQWKNKV